MSDADYQTVDDALPDFLPPITREEAEKAMKRLYRKFGRLDSGRRMTRYPGGVRRCWISKRDTRGVHRGWGRLIHDISHNIFGRIYPRKRPHDPLHVQYETDIAKYVAQSGWLKGGLIPKARVKPTKLEKHSIELGKADAAIKRWEAKQRRAHTALKKWRTKRSRLRRSQPAFTLASPATQERLDNLAVAATEFIAANT